MEIFKTLGNCCLIVLASILPFGLSAQFSEDFTDEELLNAPTWIGNLEDFVINADLQLQLNAPAAGKSFIVTPSLVHSNASWEFSFRLDFNPSSQNYAKVYLMSDVDNLNNPTNGYFVMIGGSDDDISLYVLENGASTKLIDGEDGKLNSNGTSGKIKVTKDADGNWELLTAITETSTYIKEGEAIDNRNIAASYFGIYCEYTSTRSDKFFFDDINVTGDAFRDTSPPALVSIEATSPSQLLATFSEPIAHGTQPGSFEIKPAIGHPKNIVFKDDPAQLDLYFETTFTTGAEYLFTAIDIADTAQNVSPVLSLSFQHLIPASALFRDVVINEIMPDPTPIIGLPEAEFIEIYNQSNKSFDLAGWIIGDNTGSGKIRAGYILPGEYIILCGPPDSVSFAKFGKVIPVSGFPSLNNDSDLLHLKNPTNEIIDQLHYTKSWYKSSLRSDGGYSLEMIDPSNPCSSEDNWRASEHHDGGTPGRPNSVQGSKPDNTGPVLLSVYPERDLILLTFNEVLDPKSVENGEYILNNQIIEAEAQLDPAGSVITLALRSLLDEHTTYTIAVKGIKDCNGNFIDIEENSLSFALPVNSDSLDVIINEVLFNPNTGGADFVEIYNNSANYIDLKDWNLANIAIEKESGKPLIANRKIILDHHRLLAPKEFLVLTPDIADIYKNYPRAVESKMIQLGSFPSFPDDAGSVVILNEKNVVIDRFDYQEDFHSPIISESDGVSLERISYDAPTQAPHNWTSAASTAGFATPGRQNSHSRSMTGPNGTISINPKVIVPDNDGFQDFTTIQYVFPNKSYIGNVYVFDIEGNKVSTIAENQSFAAEGFFSWAGTNEKGDRLRLGIYMIFVEVFDFDGSIEVYKEAVAIGSKF